MIVEIQSEARDGEIQIHGQRRRGGRSAGRPMPDGREPEPGGWNRLLIEVDDIEAEVERITRAGVEFRNEIISGPGGRQILAEDLDGNPIELFEAG